MGAFDDLIPAETKAPTGAFDDLVPKDSGREFGADFADLIPAAAKDTASRGYQAEVRKAEQPPIDRPARMTLTRGGQSVLAPDTEATFTREAPWSAVVESLPAQLVGGTESMVANVGEMQGKNQIEFLKSELDKIAKSPYPLPKEQAHYERLLAEAQAKVPAQEAAAQKAREIAASVTPPDMSTMQKGVSSFVQSAPSTLAAVVTGVVTKNPAAAMAIGGFGGFVQQASQTYGEAIVNGATHEVAQRAAVVQGAIELFDAVPIGVALKPGSSFLKRLGQTLLTEPLTEGAQQALQDLDAYVEYDPKMTLGEAWQNVQIAMVAGAIGAHVYGGAGHAMESSHTTSALRQVAKDIEAVDVTQTGTREQAVASMHPDRAQYRAVEISTPSSVAQQQEEVAARPTAQAEPPPEPAAQAPAEAVQAAPSAPRAAEVVAEPQAEPARASEPAAAPAALQSVEDVPADLVIHEPTLVEETGETVQVKRNAREAFKEAEQRVNRYSALIECMRKAA